MRRQLLSKPQLLCLWIMKINNNSDNKENLMKIGIVKIRQLKDDRKYDSNVDEENLQDKILFDINRKPVYFQSNDCFQLLWL